MYFSFLKTLNKISKGVNKTINIANLANLINEKYLSEVKKSFVWFVINSIACKEGKIIANNNKPLNLIGKSKKCQNGFSFLNDSVHHNI